MILNTISAMVAMKNKGMAKIFDDFLEMCLLKYGKIENKNGKFSRVSIHYLIC